MTDTERLNLIEHYKWDIMHHKGWLILGKFGSTATCQTIREAINEALAAQIKWSTGK